MALMMQSLDEAKIKEVLRVTPDGNFGIGYVLSQVVESVKAIDLKLGNLVTKDELKDTRDEFSKRIERLEESFKQGPIHPWVLSVGALGVAVATAVLTALALLHH